MDDWRKRPRKPRPDLAARNVASAKHGMYGSPTWKSWDAMKQRCTNPRSKDWPNYGGRGIVMDDRWMSFQCFLEDMGARPDGHTLGRQDNDGPYTKANCRWETGLEQNNNRRSSRLIEYAGRCQSVAQWAREIGMSRHTLLNRLNAGWSIQEAIATGVSYANRRK